MSGTSCGPYEIMPHGSQWAIKAGPLTLLVVDTRKDAVALAKRARRALRPTRPGEVAPEPKSFAAQDDDAWPQHGDRPEAETADEQPRPSLS